MGTWLVYVCGALIISVVLQSFKAAFVIFLMWVLLNWFDGDGPEAPAVEAFKRKKEKGFLNEE